MRKSSDTARDQRVRHQPFAGQQEERQKESKMKTMRQHIIAMIGEFVGTFMFLWFSFAIAQTSSATGNVAGTAAAVTLTSLGFGFSLLVNVWAFYRISGGLFNPAVSSISVYVLVVHPANGSFVGHTGYGHHWQFALVPRPVVAPHATVGCYRRRRAGQGHDPNTHGYQH